MMNDKFFDYIITYDPGLKITISINSGDFKGIVYKLDDFKIFPHPPIESNIGYNYHVVSGEIPINKGEEFKDLTRDIVKSIILKLHNNKEVLIEST